MDRLPMRIQILPLDYWLSMEQHGHEDPVMTAQVAEHYAEDLYHRVLEQHLIAIRQRLAEHPRFRDGD